MRRDRTEYEKGERKSWKGVDGGVRGGDRERGRGLEGGGWRE